MTLPDRQERAKMRDPQKLWLELAEKGVLAPPPDAIRLNTAVLAPADAALLITHLTGQRL
ncbi:hypothetical protein [Deinococcus sp.]|uniref:hypothetical protein n=1 Tax=Deinococcus sp. TaxID=47478 RepID=UPI0025B80FD2|nr:hypothetical protein [Deinococcus sp.]